MKKLKFQLIYLGILIIFIFCGTSRDTVNAYSKDSPASIEKLYMEIGYKTVEEAVHDFETYYKEDVKLPLMIPSIPFTHQFGRFSEDKVYHINDSLEVEYLNEKSGDNFYKINIRSLKNKIDFKNSKNQKEYTLQNGEKAVYVNSVHHNFLVLEKGKWQYIFGVNKKISNKITPETLVQIANSIH
ncbi:hypothetical protein A8F94_00830 [Bacillus sp. FJAT-27225]|nr:hypothetical protein A8F94_00830 [Bacillus sp. FJAT-27225]